ncbi:MAG TPA: GNAT family N-acetyltransferase, partial [Ramlibacter sp.]
MSSFALVPADAVEPAHLHAAFTQAFADYLIGPFELALAQWPQFLARQGVSLALSRVAMNGDEPLAFCLAAPRPEVRSWRLGTMGAVPAARGSGAAPVLLGDFIVRAKAAGMAFVELECFAQNTRALRLYEGRGFATVDTLHGYERAAGPLPQAAPGVPTTVALDDAFAWLDACQQSGCELPLQVTSRALGASQAPLQAWREGSAQVVFS